MIPTRMIIQSRIIDLQQRAAMQELISKRQGCHRLSINSEAGWIQALQSSSTKKSRKAAPKRVDGQEGVAKSLASSYSS